MASHEISVRDFSELCLNAPQYIDLPEFEIDLGSSAPYTFEGCVTFCRDGGVSLSLRHVVEDNKLMDTTQIKWTVSVQDVSGTGNTVEGQTSLYDSDEDTRSIHVRKELFTSYPDELRVKWSVAATCSDQDSNVTEITSSVQIMPPITFHNQGAATREETSASGNEYLMVPSPLSGANTHDPDECYKMDACPRGICVVLVNDKFYRSGSDAVELTNLLGFDKDRDALKATFEKLCFIVRILENVSDEDILKIMKDISREDHTNYDCFVCCLLSHGGEGHIFGANGRKVDVTDITSLFRAQNCASLTGTPKLFFIQACQGQNKQPGVQPLTNRLQSLALEETEFCPDDADFLLGYATLSNYVAWCHTKDGGWYIQALTKALNKMADEGRDIHEILTCVNKDVSQLVCVQKDRNDSRNDTIWMQVPAPQYTLRKKLKFFNHNHNLPANPGQDQGEESHDNHNIPANPGQDQGEQSHDNHNISANPGQDQGEESHDNHNIPANPGQDQGEE